MLTAVFFYSFLSVITSLPLGWRGAGGGGGGGGGVTEQASSSGRVRGVEGE